MLPVRDEVEKVVLRDKLMATDGWTDGRAPRAVRAAAA